MKRYNLIPVTLSSEVKAGACLRHIEDSDGEWIRYADVKNAVEAHADWVECGVWCDDKVDKKCVCNDISKAVLPKLNENHQSDEPRPDFSWVCPAHGYKRL